MADNIAKSACASCHTIKPRTEMKRVSVTEASGQSFGGTLGKKGVSARQYFRTKKVWVCDSCMKERHSKAMANYIVLAIVIVAILFFIS